jgi:hypothetical protein
MVLPVHCMTEVALRRKSIMTSYTKEELMKKYNVKPAVKKKKKKPTNTEKNAPKMSGFEKIFHIRKKNIDKASDY